MNPLVCTERPPFNMTNDGWYALNRAYSYLIVNMHTLTNLEFTSIKHRHERGAMTIADRDAMSCEAAARLESAADNFNSTQLAIAGGSALMCHAIGGGSCVNLKQAVAVFEYMEHHA